jgi:hypothetical protein
MRHKLFIGGLCALFAAAIVQADHKQETKIKVEISDDGSGDQTFVFDSEDAGFDLQSMQVGESRSVTDRNGTTADVRRTEGGFELDLNGKTLELPDIQTHDGMHGEHDVEVLVDIDDADNAKGAKKVKKIKVMKSGAADGVTIISGGEIDTATRERIAEALQDSGHKGEIMYIDDESLAGEHQAGARREVRVIKKEVDVTN